MGKGLKKNAGSKVESGKRKFACVAILLRPFGSRRSPGGGNGNLFQYSCLENPMDGGAWQAIQSMGPQKSWSPLSNQAHTASSNRPCSKEILLGCLLKKHILDLSCVPGSWYPEDVKLN